MKQITILLVMMALLAGCAVQKKVEGKIVMLEHKALKGNHCESSAILNALNYQGWEISEEQIIGAGAAPGFVYEKGKFPFLGGRTLNLRENLAIQTGLDISVKDNPKGPEWDEIEALLEQDIPVILRVDMRFLPYRYGGKYGPRYMSFGWHPVTLFGLDRQNSIAYITDTEFDELQEISLKDLQKARFSKTKIFPPEGEYYWFDKPQSQEELQWSQVTEASLVQYARAMNEVSTDEMVLSGISGLENLAYEVRNINDSVSSWMVAPILEYHYGCIETNGTGGAAFRSMYLRYLQENMKEIADDELLAAAESCEESWHDLAEAYRTAGLKYKKAKSPERKVLLDQVAIKAEELYEAEKYFINFIESKFGI